MSAQTSVGTSCGEAGVPTVAERPHQPCGTPAAARRHHKRGEELDPACREAFRRYHREYRRAARALDAFRQREREAGIRWEQRVKADPKRRDERNRAQRRRAAAKRAAARRAVDAVAVERFVAGDDTIALNRAEKRCAYKEMLRRGVPRRQVVARLRISWSTACSFDKEVVENRLNVAAMGGQNGSGADQRANADRLLTEPPAYPGGRLMPSIAAHTPDDCQGVAG